MWDTAETVFFCDPFRICISWLWMRIHWIGSKRLDKDGGSRDGVPTNIQNLSRNTIRSIQPVPYVKVRSRM